MLNAILDWSLKNRLIVLIGGVAVIIAGVLAFTRLPVDAFPDTTPVQVQINTVAPALSPLEIERQATARIEQAISGLPHLQEVRSISKFGLSQVTCTFEEGTDIYLARQVVSERLLAVELPAAVQRPQMGPVATGLGEVFQYLVTGRDKSLSEVRTTHDWVIRPQLRPIRGVAEVNAWGGDERQIQVAIDPLKLQKFGLTLTEVAEALENNNSNVGGGTLDQAGQSNLIQGIGIVTRLPDIEAIVIAAHEGVPIRIRDVARVVDGREIRRGAVTADGKGEAVLGIGFMLIGENSHDVTDHLASQLEEIRKTLPKGIDVTPVYKRTTLVDKVLHTVKKSLFEGAILVIAVLFVLLGNLRAGLIVAAAIPLSMLFAFDLMVRAGITGSLMSLGALDFGLIVDGSVIIVENSVRRLGEDHGQRTRVEIVREAAAEVLRPAMFGGLIIMLVYLPILALEGVEGKMFRPMALTVIFALIGSMIFSVTLMPVLASFVLPRKLEERDNLIVRSLKRVYRPALAAALRHRAIVLAIAAALLAGSFVIASRLGAEFIPRLKEGAIVINTVRLPGVAVDESVRYGTVLERLLLAKFPDEIEHIWTRTGTAEVATDPMGLELSDVFITLKPVEQWKHASTQDQLVEQMEQELSALPGTRLSFTQPIEMRVNEMVAGVRADLGIKLFGDDLEVLRRKAAEIEAAVRAVDGAEDVASEQISGQPMLQIEVDADAIARYGIPKRDVLDVIHALGTFEVGQLQEGERRFPITLRIDDSYRTDEKAIGRILVTAANGDRIPLSRLAHMRFVEGASTINREWAKRRIVIQANVRGRDIGSFVGDVQKAIASKVSLPAGYYIQYGGQFEHLQRARSRLMIVVPVALALIDGLCVFSGVPLATVGGVLALWIRGMPFSISAGVGFIALFGVAVLNGLVMVSAIRAFLEREVPLVDAIRQAAEQRIRPVLMTAMVASLGFLPMALNTGIGAEVQRPLATVVIGGLVSATLLTLLVLPVLYTFLGPRPPKQKTTADPVVDQP
jgi:cobalt-zinc-cadmium resistance protein CzcA